MKYQILYILLLITSSLYAQESHYWQLTDDDGLASMEVYYLYQDKKGYMWIGTDKGLCRYDGLKVKQYKHPKQKGNAVTLISEDDYGRIWYKTFKGQLLYVDEEDKEQLFDLPEELEFNTYSNYTILGDDLCVATNRLAIYNMTSQTWTLDSFPNVPPAGNMVVNNIISDKKGNLFFTTVNKELWTRKDGQNKLLGSFEDWFMPFPFGEDSLILALFDFNNTIYVDTDTKVASLSEESKLFLPETKQEKHLMYLHYDGNLLWVGTSAGLYAYQRDKDGKWAVVHELLTKEKISAIFRTKEGSLWVGTLHNGVFVFPSVDICYYNKENSELENSYINCIEKDAEGHLLLGGSDGVVMRFNVEEERLVDSYKGKKSNVISIVFDEKREQIIFDTRGLNVSKWKNSRETTYYGSRTGGNHTMAIFYEDILMLGKNAFLAAINLSPQLGEKPVDIPLLLPRNTQALFDVGKNINYSYWTVNIQDHERITAFWEDKVVENKHWVGANDSLFVYHDLTKKPILDTEGNSFIVSDIVQGDDGSIWASSIKGGVYKVVNDKVVSNYNLERGFPSDNAMALAIDREHVWVATNAGIVKLNIETEEVETYDRLDGLRSNEIRDIEVLNGKVWAATLKGLISFDTSTVSINSQRPFIELSRLEVNKKIYDWNKKGNFSYEENTLKFNFQTTALKGLDKVTYEYRLLGIDTAWIQLPSTTNFVQLQGLVDGDFVFEVRAVNEDGVRSAEPARFPFVINPPYWKTWWFQLMVYFIIAFVIGLISWWRYQIYKREQHLETSMNRLKMQALQSQMNPHFVFNAMSAIQDYWMQEESKNALIYHAKFAKLMRLIFAYSKELSIHIEEELEFLKVYVSLEQMRFEGKVDVEFDVDDALLAQEIYLTPLLIQPLVENCFKHGLLHKDGVGNIKISLKNENNYVYCAIQDNGIGREQAKEYASWRENFKKKISSLDVTQERLNILNESYGLDKNKKVFKITDLKSADGEAKGTLIEVWIPNIEQLK